MPRLRALLHFGGTVDLLNMLSLALRDSAFFSIRQPSLNLWFVLVSFAYFEVGQVSLKVLLITGGPFLAIVCVLWDTS